MAGWHHWLDGHEFEWTPGVGDGQGGLACCNSRSGKESDTTEWLNWTELNWNLAMPKNAQTTAQLHSSHMLVNNAQNSPSQASAICELWTFRCSSWFYKRQRNQRSNCQHPLDHQKKQENSRKTSISALLTMPKPLTVYITINCGNSERDGNTRPPHLPFEKLVCMSGSNS